MTYLAIAWRFLKGVPWQVYASAAMVIAFLTYGEHRADGREAEIMARLETARVEAERKSLEAIATADTKAAERAETEAAVIAEQIKAIEAAEAAGGNPLDVLF